MIRDWNVAGIVTQTSKKPTADANLFQKRKASCIINLIIDTTEQAACQTEAVPAEKETSVPHS